MKGICANCNRELTIVAGGFCYVCDKASLGLTGEEKAAALAKIKEKIKSGGLRKSGRSGGRAPGGKTPAAGTQKRHFAAGAVIHPPAALAAPKSPEEKADQKAQEEDGGAGKVSQENLLLRKGLMELTHQALAKANAVLQEVAKIREGETKMSTGEMKEQKVSKESYWSEIGVEEKCRRLRENLKRLQRDMGQMTEMFALLLIHTHDRQGTIQAPLHSVRTSGLPGVSSLGGVLRKGDDDCYF